VRPPNKALKQSAGTADFRQQTGLYFDLSSRPLLSFSFADLEGSVRTTPIRAAVVLVLGIGLFGIGFTLGHYWTFGWTMEFLRDEVRGNLNRNVEALARLKAGNETGAMELLEHAVDTVTESLPEGRPFFQLPPATQRALQTVKVYREVYPSKDPSTELSSTLAMVPLPKAEYCSATIQTLLERAKAGGAELR
jgi:hypothetical protein